MNRKAQGSRAERRAMQILETAGLRLHARADDSLGLFDGPVDRTPDADGGRVER